MSAIDELTEDLPQTNIDSPNILAIVQEKYIYGLCQRAVPPRAFYLRKVKISFAGNNNRRRPKLHIKIRTKLYILPRR
jgi:hypothetical protein